MMLDNDYAPLQIDMDSSYYCYVTKAEQKEISKLKGTKTKIVVCKWKDGDIWNEGLRIKVGIKHE